jgi:hypothetical protein
MGARFCLLGLAALASVLASAPPTRSAHAQVPRVRLSSVHTLGVRDEARATEDAPWARDLAPVRVISEKTNGRASILLYRKDGSLDEEARRAFEEVLTDPAVATRGLNPRTLQLAIKAAYHFGARELVVVSAYRPGHGPHGEGDALDFRLTGVRAATLAAYLRTFPRAGVGIYTHPRTQFVHLDARDQSFHWLDASPPGKTWREAPLRDAKREARDDAWTPEADLPTDRLRS